jgi:hypothetical protein
LPELSERGESREQVARDMDVSPRNVQRAKRVKEKSPETFDAIKTGEVRSISEAERLAGISGGKPEAAEEPAQPLTREYHSLRQWIHAFPGESDPAAIAAACPAAGLDSFAHDARAVAAWLSALVEALPAESHSGG